jgi:ribosomal protein S12 methylthiotransferase accessory factor
VEPDHVLLLAETRQFQLTGKLYYLVSRLIDGRRSTAEIVEALRDEASDLEVRFALDNLEQKGYLREADHLPAAESAFWNLLEAATLERRTESAAVRLASFGATPLEAMRAVLGGLNIAEATDAPLTVALTDDYLRTELAGLNREMRAAGRPWLLVKPVGVVVWLGPLFSPGQTGCWECLASRLRGLQPVERFAAQQRGGEPLSLSVAGLPSTVQAALQLAGTEIRRWQTTGSSALVGKIKTLDLASLTIGEHVLPRRPQCPACGQPLDPSRQPEPIELQACKKTFTADGGHRVQRPEEVVERLQPLVSSITGVIAFVTEPKRPADEVLSVFFARHADANGASPASVAGLARVFGGSVGKGLGAAQSRASCLCEAIERFAGLQQGDEIRRRARLVDLGAEAIHPNHCMGFSARQFEERARINAQQLPFYHVPDPFDEQAEIDWTPVWSLSRQAFRYLPTDYCYYSRSSGSHCPGDSNGAASGNTYEEAILQGLLELIERDSTALWWYNRVRRPGVDLASFQDPRFDRLLAAYRDLGREVWALDLTADLGIPAMAAVSARLTEAPPLRAGAFAAAGESPPQICLAFAAHLDARIALGRALSELNQCIPEIRAPLAGEQLDRKVVIDKGYEGWLQTATLADHPYLVADPGADKRMAESYERLWSDDLRDDVHRLQSILEARGLELLVVDQTRSDVDLKVVKVIVPGLRHFWARFAPGRLYDVPVQLGWLPRPLREEELNPVPILF